MRVKDPSRTNPEKSKRSKRPNRPQDEDSSDDISGRYTRWCLSWGWGLVTSMLTDENHKSLVPWNTFLAWIYNRSIPSQVFITWSVVTLYEFPEGLESWLIFDDNLYKGELSFPLHVRSSMCGRRLCGWIGSFQLSSDGKRNGRDGECRFRLPSKSIIFFIDYLMVVKKKAEQDSCGRSHNERTRGKRWNLEHGNLTKCEEIYFTLSLRVVRQKPDFLVHWWSLSPWR